MEKKLKEQAEKKKIEQLAGMGFPEEWAKDALTHAKVQHARPALLPFGQHYSFVRTCRAIWTRPWST
jgi:uncharacterized UBP type Zn finger protein